MKLAKKNPENMPMVSESKPQAQLELTSRCMFSGAGACFSYKLHPKTPFIIILKIRRFRNV